MQKVYVQIMFPDALRPNRQFIKQTARMQHKTAYGGFITLDRE